MNGGLRVHGSWLKGGAITRALATLVALMALAPAAHAQPQEVVEYYGTDALGSVRVVFDAAGNRLARTDYVPFGEALNPTGALPSEQFTGQQRDGDAGLDYFGARYYAARFGRFSTIDPVGGNLGDPQSWNRYVYARNAPGTFVDPSGTSPVFYCEARNDGGHCVSYGFVAGAGIGNCVDDPGRCAQYWTETSVADAMRDHDCVTAGWGCYFPEPPPTTLLPPPTPTCAELGSCEPLNRTGNIGDRIR